MADQPVAIGGSKRGVVAAACYVARMHGVKSAMPMFKALQACPELVVIKPNMAKYRAISQAIRHKMAALTPLVEPLSIDEAFLDLNGTQKIHDAAPATMLVRLQNDIEAEFGLTVSIGLSYNKFLAKLASDMNKPRGFHLIGRDDALDVLADMDLTALPGVGKAFGRALSADGLHKVAHIRSRDEKDLAQAYGAPGQRLYKLAFGHDDRPVTRDRRAKSVSSETTFDEDIASAARLESILWRQCERVSGSLKAKGVAGTGITLKLKTDRFRILTRSTSLDAPTQLADRLFEAAAPLLRREIGPTRHYRLLGVGVHNLTGVGEADPVDLMDPSRTKRAQAEKAMDDLRDRFGRTIVQKGRSLD